MTGKEIGVKKYIVRLSAEEREHLSDFIRSGTASVRLRFDPKPPYQLPSTILNAV